MSRHVTLERINSSDKVAIYSVLYDGEAQNEFEKFIDEFGSQEEFKDDLGVILARIQKVENDSAADRHFRYEGKMKEHIRALPSHFDSSRLRLYCICYGECVMILGGGGNKEGIKAWQDDPILTNHVKELLQIEESLIPILSKRRLYREDIASLKDIELTIK